MSDKYKYPRTPHLPYSPGATNDDKVLKSLAHFEGMVIAATEKMDGECSTIAAEYTHARSLDSKDHPSRHWLKGLWATIRHDIPTGYRICGENLYAKHSIEYSSLDSYFYVFSVWDENNFCLSWEDTKLICGELGLITVPELYIGKFDSNIVENLQDKLSPITQEGFVIRNVGSFHYDDFDKNLAKWVRKNHVQTDSHWMQSKIVPNKLKEK